MTLPRAQSELDWIKEKLRIITEIGQEVSDGGIANKYDYHTALKLITVYYMSDVFTRVAGSANREVQGFDGTVYIDLFAGAGLVKVGDAGDIVAGSALCATKSGKGFDYGIMIEKNRERCNCLKERISKIPQVESWVINDDSNKAITDVLDKIESKFKKPIILVFVDPEGMEIKFKTLKAISDRFKNCDFLINVNAQGASRVVGQTKRNMPNRAQPTEEYFGEDAKTVLRELAEKSLETKYAEQVKKILGKPIGDDIKIRGDHGRTAYYLLYYTRRTRGGSRYNEAFLKLKDKIERLDGSRVRRALDQMHGRATNLLDFT